MGVGGLVPPGAAVTGVIRQRVRGLPELAVFKVWNHDDEGEDDATEVHAQDAKYAAELWVEMRHDEGYEREYEVSLRDQQGRLWGCTVHTRVEYSFDADKPEEMEEDGCTLKVRP